MSLPNMFNKMIGLKDLEELYNNLFSFGMTIVVDILKCEGNNQVQGTC